MKIKLHRSQSIVFKDLMVRRSCRHSVVVASRGWGKSFLAGAVACKAIEELCKLSPRVPNKNVYIIAPTYDQVTDIYYPLLNYEIGLENYAVSSSRDRGIFKFPGKVELRLLSYEAVERLRGKGAYLVINDEVSSWTKGVGFKEAWESIIEPCISTRWSPKRAVQYGSPVAGRSLTISTPKGFNYFYDLYNLHESDNDWKSYHYDYHYSPLLDPNEIEKIKHRVDPLKFNREYLAQFLNSGAQVFYCFDRKIHVRKDLPDFVNTNEFKEDVHIAMDFNVGVMATSAWAIRGGQAHALDEYKGHPDTETTAKILKAKYKDRGHKVYVYPDPTGKSRKTSSPIGQTDFSILTAHGFNVLAKPASPLIVDSVQAVNTKFKNAAGGVDAYVRNNCVGLIESFEKTAWVDSNPDLAVIDKKEGHEHFSDGARYFFDFKFPVLAGTKRTSRGFSF
jgi:hypothetical protein